jgi:hypothetical protein
LEGLSLVVLAAKSSCALGLSAPIALIECYGLWQVYLFEMAPLFTNAERAEVASGVDTAFWALDAEFERFNVSHPVGLS